MSDDPMVEEVRRVHEQYAARFNYDLATIRKDLRRRTEGTARAGRQVVSLPPPRVEPTPTQPRKIG